MLEGTFPDAGDSIRNRDGRQAGAEPEGPFPNAGDAVWNCDTRQAGAGEEGPIPDAGDAIRDRDARQAAVTEGVTPDAGDAVRYRDARQAGAVCEGTYTDAGNRFAFNGIWDNQFAQGPDIITIGDGDLSVSRGVSQVS